MTSQHDKAQRRLRFTEPPESKTHDYAGSKRWPKFSIRELFLCMLVVALCVGWWRDWQRSANEINTLKKALETEIENRVWAGDLHGPRSVEELRRWSN